MDIEVGCMVTEPFCGDERVRPGTLPTAQDASLRYSRYALRANRALLAAFTLDLEQAQVRMGERARKSAAAHPSRDPWKR